MRPRAPRSARCSSTSATSSPPATSGCTAAFLHTFLAMRAAEAQSPASVLAMLVAIGDTAAQVAQEEGAGTDRGRRADAAAHARHREHRARGQRPDRRRARSPHGAGGELVEAARGRSRERARDRIAGDTNVGKVRDDERGLADRRAAARAVRRARRHGRRERRRRRLADGARCDPRVRAAAPRRRSRRRRCSRRAIQAGSAAVFAAAQREPRAPRHGHHRASPASWSTASTLVVAPRRRQPRVPAARRPAAGADARSHDRRGARRIAACCRPTRPSATRTRTCCRATSARGPRPGSIWSRWSSWPAIGCCCAPTGCTATRRAEAIQYVLGSGDAPEQVARDLIELALRGGGGDNVSTIVIEAPQAAPTSTQVVRTTGATAWWQKRAAVPRGREGARADAQPDRARPRSEGGARAGRAAACARPIFHDLEKSTGVNVWTFAQNLAGGWFERGGEWAAVRGMIDILGMSARTVVDEVRAADAKLGFLLDVAVQPRARGGGARARRAARRAAAPGRHRADRAASSLGETLDGDAPTTCSRPASGSSSARRSRSCGRIGRSPTPACRPRCSTASHKTLTIARGTDIAARRAGQAGAGGARDDRRSEGGGNFATAVLSARELYGVRSVDDAGVMPLFDALDQARIITASSVHQIADVRGATARACCARSATAHQRLVGAATGLVLEAVGAVQRAAARGRRR